MINKNSISASYKYCLSLSLLGLAGVSCNNDASNYGVRVEVVNNSKFEKPSEYSLNEEKSLLQEYDDLNNHEKPNTTYIFGIEGRGMAYQSEGDVYCFDNLSGLTAKELHNENCKVLLRDRDENYAEWFESRNYNTNKDEQAKWYIDNYLDKIESDAKKVIIYATSQGTVLVPEIVKNILEKQPNIKIDINYVSACLQGLGVVKTLDRYAKIYNVGATFNFDPKAEGMKALHPKEVMKDTEEFVSMLKNNAQVNIKAVKVNSPDTITDFANDFVGGNKTLAWISKIFMLPWFGGGDSLLTLKEQGLTSNQAEKLGDNYLEINLQGRHCSAYDEDFQKNLVQELYNSDKIEENRNKYSAERKNESFMKRVMNFFTF